MKTKLLFKTKNYYLLSVLFICCFAFSNFSYGQQNTTITGVITEAETSTPLPGVNVVEKNTSNGTTTDFDGNFTLNVASPDAVLVITYIGFKTQEYSLNGTSNINITLEPDTQSLDEVVVIGYGTQKKSDLTGAVGSLDSESLTERSMNNPLEALQGNVPGVQISPSTGRIGDGFDITIRGKNSLSGNTNPLFVVDGVPTDNIDFLNPQDIQRMDILKDASSTAIYGSRGSNGVVIVTTKSGANAPSNFTVTLDSYMGVKDVARLPEMMGGQKWWYYHQSAYLATASNGPNGYVTPETLYDAVIGDANSELERRALNNETFDWYDAVLKTGIQQNNYVNVSGRTDDGMGYNLGIGAQKETGNIQNEELKKYTFKSGLDKKINDKFSIGANFTVALTEQQDGSDNAMQQAFRLNPFLDPYGLNDNELFPLPGKLTDANGDFVINKTSTYNPLLEIANTTNETRRWTGVGNVYFQYNILDWLSFKTTYSAGYSSYRNGQAWGAMTSVGVDNNDLPSAEMSKGENFNGTWDNQFNIDYTFNDAHTFNFLALQSLYYSRTETSFQSSRNMPFDTGFYNIGSGEQGTFNLGSNYSKQTLSSYALRLNYSYKDKYLLTLSNRWDGSSLLSQDKQWDTFPSAAIGWRVSEEGFLKESNTVSNLKLRASYGYTGNNNVSPYSTQNSLDRQLYYDFNGTSANGWLPSALANKSLGWEKTREMNFGIDYGFFNNRLNGSVDVYDRLSDDLILEQRLPIESGWSSINANVASVKNTGVEASLTGILINNQKVTWSTTLTFTKNNNSIEELYGQDEVDDVGNGWFIGEDIDAIYNYDFDGIWQGDEVAEATSYNQTEGQAKVRDINNDGVIDPADDRIILGTPNPDWSGSLFTKLTVGNIDLSASLITNQGVYVYSPFHANFTNTEDRGRQKLDIDWYVPENQAGVPAQASNNYPQPRNMGTFWRNDGVGYYRDASFVKVKNISLGYTFGQNIIEKLNIKHFRIYANVLNPFVFTDYDGYDPEWAGAGLGVGRVSNITYQLGINLKF
ncbi:SusC/RagA family TonB-linked outer membrane protein [Galbibacter orientalis]|uniref:TonB-linked outer membrane protein, SusC/RagA family n=1 Tax=Galbibacter orientalis DSM 19592 TaxID=926559 RepID=I3C150_9FLAO|nr:TonB-dependent receptor [Galbibacter orientalis]EIJ37343.1 TonB-linked outer membrane protein, SusC/RagA family [Galbibacter orientalis DSM 19592]